MVITASYVGSRAYDLLGGAHGLHLGHQREREPVESAIPLARVALLQTVPNPFFGAIQTGSLAGPTTTQTQLLRPYPQYTGVTRVAPGFGNSHYHSAQFQLEKRTSNGLTAQVAYTIAKNLTDLNNADNAYDRRTARAYSSFDVPQRFSISAAWELPFGRGRRFGARCAKLDLLAGGWTLSTYQVYQGGFPLAFGLARAHCRRRQRPSQRDRKSGRGNRRSDRQPPEALLQYRAFAQPADYTYGNLAAKSARSVPPA